jgi:xanthine/CO dehydrogenase XdhC/CoxF family maturation factor
LERARKVLKSGEAEVFTYDTTVNENSVFSLNMGCRGVIRILIEPIHRTGWLTSLYESVWKDREKQTFATYIGGDQAEKLSVGERLFVGRGEKISETGRKVVDLFPEIDDDLLTFYESDAVYDTMRYVNSVGEAEFAFESLEPPVLLTIFGAGADAVPLAEAAHDLGWRVRMFDHRPAFLTRERFPSADEISLVDQGSQSLDLTVDKLTAILSINHNYDRDRETLSFALKTNAFYIGALGPKKRTEQLLEELRERGEVFGADAISRLRYPAGLDIGGDTPESIAISIVAEIQSVLKRRPGGALRDRDGSIYGRK